MNWDALAHAQVVSSHREVCSAVMLFADLHRLKSPARRVLLFPEHWLGHGGGRDGGEEKGANRGSAGTGGLKKVRADVVDPYLASTRRLLRLAARRYRVELRPIGGENNEKEDSKSWLDWLSGADDEQDERMKENRVKAQEKWLREHGLAAVLGMTEFERALVMRTPGWVLDATVLDGVLAYTEMGDAGVAVVEGLNGTDAMLAGPGSEVALALRQTVSVQVEAQGEIDSKQGDQPKGTSERSSSTIDLALLRSLGVQVVQLDEPEAESQSSGNDDEHFSEETEAVSSSHPSVRLTTSISALHEPPASEKFNSTRFLTSAAYITFTDTKLPGPEYEVPFTRKVEARPRNKEADWVWTKLYGGFAEKRREVCGLDLEGWYRV